MVIAFSSYYVFSFYQFLFLNFYPFNKGLGRVVLYILGWTLFSIVFEWFVVNTDFFYYNGWKLLYSALVYPIIFLILVSNLKLVRKIMASK